MSLSCSLRLAFRGFCLQNEQGHQYTTGMETAQVALDYSAWSHATRFTVQDPHSSLDLRSGIRNISPPIGRGSLGTVHQEMGVLSPQRLQRLGQTKLEMT